MARPSEIFTPRLWTLATTATDELDDRAAKINVIATDAALRQEATRVLPELERMQARPSNEQLYGALQPLLVVKRLPDFGKGVEAEKLTQAWLAVYYTTLRKLPLAAVRPGVAKVLEEHVYPDMPQPAEIFQAAEPFAIKIRTAHYRIKRALKIEHRNLREIDRKANMDRMREAGWLNEKGEFDIKRCMASVRRPPIGTTAARPLDLPSSCRPGPAASCTPRRRPGERCGARRRRWPNG